MTDGSERRFIKLTDLISSGLPLTKKTRRHLAPDIKREVLESLVRDMKRKHADSRRAPLMVLQLADEDSPDHEHEEERSSDEQSWFRLGG